MRPQSLPQLSFADLEFAVQGIVLSPELDAISNYLRSLPEATDLVRADVGHGLARPGRGRPGLPLECVLRSFVLWRIDDLTYRELRQRIADSPPLRKFVGLRSNKVPLHHAFQRAFARIRPETLREINRLVVARAAAQGLVTGSRLRIDATVVESDILYPTDGGLLSDTVRVLCRLTGRLSKLVPGSTDDFHDHTRAAKKRAYEIHRLGRRRKKSETMEKEKYRALLKLAKAAVAEARAAEERAAAARMSNLLDVAAVESLREEIRHFVALGERVISQAHRRVFQGEMVPAAEKIVSIFEPHTDIIVRNKARKPVEFGHKVFLAEIGEGLVAHYEVAKGSPADAPWLTGAIEVHRRIFGHAPEVCAADRGFYTADNVRILRHAGVTTESVPYKGRSRSAERTAYQRTPEFKAAQRFRCGVEGRISVLARGRGMDRCPLRGSQHFEMFVGAAILANNLKKIAVAMLARSDTIAEAAVPA